MRQNRRVIANTVADVHHVLSFTRRRRRNEVDARRARSLYENDARLEFLGDLGEDLVGRQHCQ